MKVTYIQHCGSDLSVVNAARVSFKKEHRAFDMKKDSKLISYLAKHGHTSPFNHAFITLHVKAPIFVARQLQKHKFMPWNEVSRRYVDDEPEFYVPEVWRGRSKDKKQGSFGVVTLYEDKPQRQAYHPSEIAAFSRETYEYLIDSGVAPEQARMVLPQSMYTEWFWSGTLGAWADMYNLRSSPDTQEETRQIALQAGAIIRPLFPYSWEALVERN